MIPVSPLKRFVIRMEHVSCIQCLSSTAGIIRNLLSRDLSLVIL